jgi:MFS family permease
VTPSPPTSGSASAARTESGNTIVLLAMAAASFLAPLNSSMLAVALPDIRESFGVSVAKATWLVSAYLVSVAVAQPVGGRLGDAFGCRRVILIGLAVLFA